MSYSTSEQWTGKYWLDGKKIYRKVIEIENISDGTVIATIDGVIVNSSGYFVLGGNVYNIPCPGRFFIYRENTTTTNVKVSTGGTITIGYVVLEYTKTTD